MKDNFLNFSATIILAAVLSLVLPWWSVMVAAFVTSYFLSLKKSAVFFIPFLAVSLFWSLFAWFLSSANDFIMAKKIAVLLPFQGKAWVLIIITGLIGGTAAGISAIFGNQFRIFVNLFKIKN